MGFPNRCSRRVSQLKESLFQTAFQIVLLECALLTAQTKPSAKRPVPPVDNLQQHYDAARTYGLSGDTQRSKAEYQAFLAEALRRIGNGWASAGDVKVASDCLDESLSIAPENPDALLDRASAYLTENKLPEAKALALKAAKPGATNPRQEYLLGRIFLQQDDYKSAKEHLEKAVAATPTFEVGYALATAYLNLKDLQRARLLFDDMLLGFGDAPGLHIQIARAYRENEYWEEAITELKKTSRKYPQAAQVHYFTGLAYMGRDNDSGIPAALPEFRAELQLSPNDYRSRYMYGYALLKQHDLPTAESELMKASALQPENPDPWHLLAQVYLENGDKAKAEQSARKEIALTKDEASNNYQVSQAHYQLARLLLESGKREEAMRELNVSEEMRKRRLQRQVAQQNPSEAMKMNMQEPRIVEPHSDTEKNAATADMKKQAQQYTDQLKPAVANAYNNLGVMAAGQKEFSTAEAYFEKAGHWDPSLDKLDRNQGMAAFYSNNFEKAITPLFRELQSHPDDFRVRAALGLSYFSMDNYAAVVETLRPAESHLGEDPGVGAAYAVSLVKIGNYEQGMNRLKNLAVSNANSAEIHQFLGGAFADQGIYASAIEEFRKSLALDPSQQRTHFLLGLALIHQGTLADAVPEMRTALKLDPTDVSAKYHLAFSLAQIGDKAEALGLLRQVIEQDKTHADAYYQLGKIQLEQGDAKAAIPSLETASKLSPDSDYVHYQLALAYRRDSRTEDAEREMEQYQAIKTRRKGNHEQPQSN
jgi:tetratricopeptide (TPR) repeat protein